MKLRYALLLILVVSATLMPIIATQPISQTSTPKPTLESAKPATTSCDLIKPNDPGSGGGGKGET